MLYVVLMDLLLAIAIYSYMDRYSLNRMFSYRS